MPWPSEMVPGVSRIQPATIGMTGAWTASTRAEAPERGRGIIAG